jgi:cation transporter-like permease
MRNATRVTVSAFGVLAGLAGLEHGIGEVLQGNIVPEGIVIQSWAGSELFRALGGEPAMTIIPNLLVSGIRTIFLSLAFTVWASLRIHRASSGCCGTCTGWGLCFCR